MCLTSILDIDLELRNTIILSEHVNSNGWLRGHLLMQARTEMNKSDKGKKKVILKYNR